MIRTLRLTSLTDRRWDLRGSAGKLASVQILQNTEHGSEWAWTFHSCWFCICAYTQLLASCLLHHVQWLLVSVRCWWLHLTCICHEVYNYMLVLIAILMLTQCHGNETSWEQTVHRTKQPSRELSDERNIWNVLGVKCPVTVPPKIIAIIQKLYKESTSIGANSMGGFWREWGDRLHGQKVAGTMPPSRPHRNFVMSNFLKQ